MRRAICHLLTIGSEGLPPNSPEAVMAMQNAALNSNDDMHDHGRDHSAGRDDAFAGRSDAVSTVQPVEILLCKREDNRIYRGRAT